MNLIESFRVSIRGLANNKLRSALTMLGIIIGVGVVILVVAIGEGATKRVTDTVNSLGTNLLTVWAGSNRVRVSTATPKTDASSSSTSSSSSSSSQSQSQGFTNRMTLEDATQLPEHFPKTVEAVAPSINGGVSIRMGNKDSTTQLTGTTIDYPYVKSIDIDKGRFFTEAEIEGSQKVCVVGTTIAEKLTGDAQNSLVGQTISVNRQNFLVVGMQAPKGATSWGQDQDDLMLVPITTAMRRVLNRRNISMVSVRCTSQQMMPLAQEQIYNFLRNRHHIPPPYPDNDDFRIFNQTDLLATQQSVTGTMTSLLSAVAVISLVVGGIGIMNIMLVSVTERTREIGIRKAIGATPRDILLQFLIESSILSLIGGIIGILLGVGGAYLLATVAQWNAIVNATAVIAAVAVSVGVGLFFGIYPASKAAKLHPIVALRFE